MLETLLSIEALNVQFVNPKEAQLLCGDNEIQEFSSSRQFVKFTMGIDICSLPNTLISSHC